MTTQEKPKDTKAEILSQILHSMEEKDRMHNEVMFGTATSFVQGSNSLVQSSKPKTALEQESDNFMSKIAGYDFGIRYS